MIPINQVYFWSNNQIKYQYLEPNATDDPRLIIEYRMRPVLRVPVFSGLSAKLQPAAAATMIWSQCGASVWLSWAITSCYHTTLDRADKDTGPSSPDQLCPDPGGWEKTLSSNDTKSERSSFDEIVFNMCLRGHRGHRWDNCNCMLFAISNYTKAIFRAL